jgi:hypothetical protein
MLSVREELNFLTLFRYSSGLLGFEFHFCNMLVILLTPLYKLQLFSDPCCRQQFKIHLEQ